MGDVTGIERTLVLLKPDAVSRGLVGRVLSRFEDALLKIVASKMVWMDADLNRQHYFDLEDRFGPEVYNAVASFMQTGPVFAFVLEGVEAVAIVRKLVGATYPDEAAPGKAYANANGLPVANLVHASANPSEAKREIDVWFAEDDIFNYHTLAEKYVS
jgi:nucleoside-diphosphate kinase